MSNNIQQMSQEIQDRIRELAYLMWESAGRQQGMAMNYWLSAEQEILATMQAAAESVMPAGRKAAKAVEPAPAAAKPASKQPAATPAPAKTAPSKPAAEKPAAAKPAAKPAAAPPPAAAKPAAAKPAAAPTASKPTTPPKKTGS